MLWGLGDGDIESDSHSEIISLFIPLKLEARGLTGQIHSQFLFNNKFRPRIKLLSGHGSHNLWELGPM